METFLIKKIINECYKIPDQLMQLLNKFSIDQPNWFINTISFYLKINFLERKIFGLQTNKIKEIVELESLKQIGPKKAIGYSICILTKYLNNKYCSNDYVILQNGLGTYIIYIPTVKLLCDKNIEIINKMKSKLNINNKSGLFVCIKYIMEIFNGHDKETLELIFHLFGFEYQVQNLKY